MSELHPKLKEILASPGDPEAVPVELQDPDEARAEWKGDMAAVDAPAPEMAEVRDIQLATDNGVLAARVHKPEGMSADAAPCLGSGGDCRSLLCAACISERM